MPLSQLLLSLSFLNLQLLVNLFYQPSEDNFDFLLFCLVKPLLPGLSWAERVNTGFSLKHPAFWGCAYCARTTVHSVTTMLLWEQLPSVWTVVKVSLAQTEGGERQAKQAMGPPLHLSESRNKEQFNNSLRSLRDLHKQSRELGKTANTNKNQIKLY